MTETKLFESSLPIEAEGKPHYMARSRIFALPPFEAKVYLADNALTRSFGFLPAEASRLFRNERQIRRIYERQNATGAVPMKCDALFADFRSPRLGRVLAWPKPVEDVRDKLEDDRFAFIGWVFHRSGTIGNAIGKVGDLLTGDLERCFKGIDVDVSQSTYRATEGHDREEWLPPYMSVTDATEKFLREMMQDVGDALDKTGFGPEIRSRAEIRRITEELGIEEEDVEVLSERMTLWRRAREIIDSLGIRVGDEEHESYCSALEYAERITEEVSCDSGFIDSVRRNDAAAMHASVSRCLPPLPWDAQIFLTENPLVERLRDLPAFRRAHGPDNPQSIARRIAEDRLDVVPRKCAGLFLVTSRGRPALYGCSVEPVMVGTDERSVTKRQAFLGWVFWRESPDFSIFDDLCLPLGDDISRVFADELRMPLGCTYSDSTGERWGETPPPEAPELRETVFDALRDFSRELWRLKQDLGIGFAAYGRDELAGIARSHCLGTEDALSIERALRPFAAFRRYLERIERSGVYRDHSEYDREIEYVACYADVIRENALKENSPGSFA